MINQTISHYKILEKLGGGGIGVVYKAEDTKLKRFVALKFLPPDLTRDDEAKERFVHEAQAASALDHPNICVIHEIDETEGGHLFIAMAYYEGETLKQQVTNGKLQVADAIDIAIQIAQGLTKAHQHGIVHRDIKPGNVIITNDGVMKIIDFGLAKLMGTPGITKTPSTMGTVAYMSPEQTQGEPVDHRTDIWSLGVVLYEMLTGQLPFKGEYDQAVIYSIMNEDPAPMTKFRPELPVELQQIIEKALQKDLEARYQHMDEMLVDLRQRKGEVTPRAITPASKKRARTLVLSGLILALIGYFFWPQPQEELVERIPVAVADFVNETKEEELDGLSGMLITALEQSRRLSVLTRSRMFDVLKQMDKANVDRIDEMLGREICQRTNVKALVVASIRKFGRLYTIDLKIIDLEKNEHLFVTNETGEGQESIPGLIDKLSAKTRAGLKERSAEIRAASQRVAEVTTINLEAYRHYFLGEQFINKLQFSEAREEFKKAVAIDSTFGLAYCRLAYANWWIWASELTASNEQLTRSALQKALALSDRLPEKERYAIRGLNAKFTGGFDFDAEIVVLQEIVRDYPNDKEMLFSLGDDYHHSGRYDSAEAYFEKVLTMDPSYAPALQHLAQSYSDMGQYRKMLEATQKLKSQNDKEGDYYLGEYYYRIGNYQAASNHIAKFLATAGEGSTSTRALEFMVRTHGKLGQCEQVFEYVKRLDYQKSFILYFPGQCFIRQSNPERAETFLLEAKKRDADALSFWTLLLFSYPYGGKYRHAFELFDEFFELNWQAKDTVNMANVQVYKALYCVWGWHDFAKARGELEKILNYSAHIPFWTNVAMLYIYSGDYALAESLLARKKEGAVNHQFVRLLIHSHKHQAAEAQVLAQHVLPALPKHMRAWALYPLAKCQFEVGQYEAALAALLQIQKPFDDLDDFVDGVFYPKSFYLMGKIYEKKGDKELAVRNYEKLLELWKNADADLPELIEAKARLAALRRA